MLVFHLWVPCNLFRRKLVADWCSYESEPEFRFHRFDYTSTKLPILWNCHPLQNIGNKWLNTSWGFFFYFRVRHCLVKINNLLMVSVWPSSFDCKREVAKRKGQSDFVAFCRMSSDLDGAYKSVNIIYKECVKIIFNLTSCITWTWRFQAFSSFQSVTNAVPATVGRWRLGAAPKASLYSFSTSHRATTPNLPLGKVAIN